MATYGFRITADPDFIRLKKKADTATINLKKNFRAGLRVEGDRFVGLAGQEARGGPTGTIAKGVFYRTYETGDIAELRVYPGKIGAYHLYGTGIRRPGGKLIVPLGNNKALKWESGGTTVFSAYSRGVYPDPFFSRAYRRWLPGARSFLRTVANSWVRELVTAREPIKTVNT